MCITNISIIKLIGDVGHTVTVLDNVEHRHLV